MIVGYNTQNAVDCKSGMIIHQEVVIDQADIHYTVPIIESIEKIKKEKLPKKQEKTHYLLDAGYSSEEILRELQDYDVYMPDREESHRRKQLISGMHAERAPEATDMLKFEYNREADTFRCPKGEAIPFYRQIDHLRGGPHREYRSKGCGKCELKEQCLPAGKNFQSFLLSEQRSRTCNVKYLEPYGSPDSMNSTGGPLTLEMRSKLRSEKGRRIFALRFVIERSFGILKWIRNGATFTRRTLPRVSVEWAERSIAYNLGCLLNVP